MFLTYIGIALSLLACGVFALAVILFYLGKTIQTQRQLGHIIILCLLAIAIGFVFCFVGKFLLR